jgi:hypothetical protein
MSRYFDVLLFRHLAPRDRRAVIAGALVLVPALLWVGAVRPYYAAMDGLRQRADAELALLQREQALIAGHGAAGTGSAAADRAERATLRLVSAANVPLAEAEVTTFLQELARLSRVLLQELRGVDPRSAGSARRAAPESPEPLRPIRLVVRGESDLEGVLTFLQRVEQSPLLMRVTGLTVEPQRESRGAERREDGAITFILHLEAFAQPDIEGAPAAEGGTW